MLTAKIDEVVMFLTWLRNSFLFFFPAKPPSFGGVYLPAHTSVTEGSVRVGILQPLAGGGAAVAILTAPYTWLRVVLLEATLLQPRPPQGTKDQTDRLSIKGFLPSHHRDIGS